MSSPFMQLYIGDYLRDTSSLSTEGHGAYLLILFAMWNADGWVSAESEKMARYARMTMTRWLKVAPDIMPFLTIENGMATQGRLLKQLEKASGKSLKRSEAGKRGARAKALKANKAPQANAVAIAEANASGLLKHLPDTRYQKPESKKKEQEAAPVGAALVSRETLDLEATLPACLDRRQPAAPPARASAEIVPLQPKPSKALTVAVSLPAWLPLDAWSRYLDMRRRIKKPPTQHAIGLLLKKLEGWRDGGHDLTEILDNSTIGNWTGLFEPKGKSHGTGQRSASAHDRLNAGGAAFIASLGDDDEQGRQGSADGDVDGPRFPLLEA